MESGILVKEICYVLELEDNCWYIGITTNLNYRLGQHWQNQGALWTRLHKPKSLADVIYPGNKKIEDDTTLEYMNTYGWEKVRGGSFCKVDLKRKPAALDTHIIDNLPKDEMGPYLKSLLHPKKIINEI